MQNGNTTAQLSQALLQFFFIVIRSGGFDLGFNLVDPALNVGFFATATYDCCIVFIDHHALGFA
jgi:hypothetical protein